MANKNKGVFWKCLVFGIIFLYLIAQIDSPTSPFVWILYVFSLIYAFKPSKKEQKLNTNVSISEPLEIKITAQFSANDQVRSTIPKTVVQPVEPTSTYNTQMGSQQPTVQTSYKIPKPPKDLKASIRWLPAGESITISNFIIDDGMLYVGTNPSQRYKSEPALIDPKLLVSREKVDFTRSLVTYWPSYTEISPSARSAYLNWLENGKKHPDADLGYVFLYFYGLERRVLVDSKIDQAASLDIPLIIGEVTRLLEIYGPRSHSFNDYASKFLSFLIFSETPKKLYASEMLEIYFANTYEMPFLLRVAIGQAAKDGVSLSVDLAFLWATYDFRVVKRTPVTRCAAEFKTLFKVKFQEQYPNGIKLNVNKTKLKLDYMPASLALNRGGYECNLGDIPDLTAAIGPVKKIQTLVDLCNAELEPYSRYIARNPEKLGSLDSLLQLPVMLWSAEIKSKLETYKSRTAGGMICMSFAELAHSFNSNLDDLSRDKIRSFARALETVHICIEPDVLVSNKTVKSEDKIVIFQSDISSIESRASSAYLNAVVTLELASCVAIADGEFSESEVQHLSDNIDTWLHLSPSNRLRLKARLKLLTFTPMTLASLKKRLEPLETETKEAIALFAATLVQADGKVTVTEVKILEKIYKLLGLDPQKVFSDIHLVVTTEDTSRKLNEQTTGTGFTLDVNRIKELQQDTAKVSALLAGIFNEEVQAPADVVSMTVTSVDEVEEKGNNILGLDRSHTLLARTLLSKAAWERQELNEIAVELGLMLDGALESINDAAFDEYNMPFTEGDAPIEINPDIIGNINP